MRRQEIIAIAEDMERASPDLGARFASRLRKAVAPRAPKYGGRVSQVLKFAANGPFVTADIVKLLNTTSPDASRLLHEMRTSGYIRRVDKHRGRGVLALYGPVEN